MICEEGSKVPFHELQHGCYGCSLKIRSQDHEHMNIYSYTETMVSLMSYVPGYRDGEDYDNQYLDVISSHGFNPDQVPPAIFSDSKSKLQL